jgi:hypothetical protein
MSATRSSNLPRSHRPAPTTRARVSGGKKKRPASAYVQSGAGRASALPSWKELARGKNERGPIRPPSFLAPVSTGRFILIVLALAVTFTAYVGHVHATQNLYSELETMRRDNIRMHLKLNRLQGEFDRVTGPAVIYEQARALGLLEGYSYGPAIRIGE